MPDMGADFYRCRGYTVEIPGYAVTLADGRSGHQVYCELCGQSFDVPGDREAARQAIPAHFREAHGMEGQLEDWYP
jgi:hypothetical protein